jgi:DNA-binding NarL/FixJ family response regulator
VPARARKGERSIDIGAILGLSPLTIDDHLAVASAKLSVRTRTRTQAVGEAMRRGFLPPSH